MQRERVEAESVTHKYYNSSKKPNGLFESLEREESKGEESNGEESRGEWFPSTFFGCF